MATEAELQVPPDSTGQKARIMQVLTMINGVLTTVFMQVVSLSDENGNPISYGDQVEINSMMLDELRAIRYGIEILINADQPNNVDLLEMAHDAREVHEDGGP